MREIYLATSDDVCVTVVCKDLLQAPSVGLQGSLDDSQATPDGGSGGTEVRVIVNEQTRGALARESLRTEALASQLTPEFL